MKDFQIMLVDDNKNNRYAIKAVLSELDVVILEAKDGASALETLMRHEINLILLDIQLPDYSGFEIAEVIKNKKSTMAIPIIFATAIYKSDTFMEKGYNLGAIDYIFKPINAKMLLTKVSYYKEIFNERHEMLKALEERNDQLAFQNHQLLKLESKMAASQANWRMLGENVPYLVEIYDESESMLFDNNKSLDNDGCLVKQLHNSDYKEQILSALHKNVSTSQLYETVNKDKHCYFDVRTRPMFDGNNKRCMVIVSDVTARHEYEENILYIGYHDQLTGLKNRHYFRNHLEKYDIEGQLPISIIMGDVNGLKMINDSFGHHMGDRLLIEAAKVMSMFLSDEDILARWGGDEFIILLPGTDVDRTDQIIRQIKEAIVHIKVEDKFPISIALGEATAYTSTLSFESLIKEAEDKMYVNKLKDQLSYRNSVVESLKRALYERDYETEEHTERLCNMALLMAKYLNLNQNDKDKLSLLGDLHDIGKIALPTAVLNKVEPLTDAEWQSIKRHPEIGYRICGSVPELISVSDLVLSHHERWDGDGYPRGLKGTEIPLLARLISIIDSFDVMTHKRPYNKKKTEVEALEELKLCSGSQFDPNLVNVFVKVYEDNIKKDA